MGAGGTEVVRKYWGRVLAYMRTNVWRGSGCQREASRALLVHGSLVPAACGQRVKMGGLQGGWVGVKRRLHCPVGGGGAGGYRARCGLANCNRLWAAGGGAGRCADAKPHVRRDALLRRTGSCARLLQPIAEVVTPLPYYTSSFLQPLSRPWATCPGTKWRHSWPQQP